MTLSYLCQTFKWIQATIMWCIWPAENCGTYCECEMLGKNKTYCCSFGLLLIGGASYCCGVAVLSVFGSFLASCQTSASPPTSRICSVIQTGLMLCPPPAICASWRDRQPIRFGFVDWERCTSYWEVETSSGLFRLGLLWVFSSPSWVWVQSILWLLGSFYTGPGFGPTFLNCSDHCSQPTCICLFLHNTH